MSPGGIVPGSSGTSSRRSTWFRSSARLTRSRSSKGRIPQKRFADAIQIVLSERSESGIADQGVLSPRTWRVADLHTKHMMLRAGLGWGNLPEHLVRDDLRQRRLVAIQPEPWGEDEHTLYLSAIYRSDTTFGPAHRWLVKHARGPLRARRNRARRNGEDALERRRRSKSSASSSEPSAGRDDRHRFFIDSGNVTTGRTVWLRRQTNEHVQHRPHSLGDRLQRSPHDVREGPRAVQDVDRDASTTRTADPTKSVVTVDIDTASIDTREEKRDAHLRSADFFDTEKFPKMTFKSKRIETRATGSTSSWAISRSAT